jgi:hypothetical protein
MAIDVETAVRSASGGGRWTGMRVHRNALIETASFLAAAVVLQWWLLEPGTLAGLKPHPFWIPVVLVSLQYGTIDGIVAVAACIATQWLLGWPQSADEDYLAHVSRTLGEPVLWLGAALVIGEFRLRQIGEIEELRAELGEAVRQRDTLAGGLVGAHDRIRRLETELAAMAPDRAAELIEVLSSLRPGAARATVERAIAVCAEVALAADCLSLFELSAGALLATLRIGSGAGSSPVVRVQPGDPLYERVVRERAVLSTLRREDRSALRDYGLFAAPVLCPRSGQVLGMLMVEHMRAAAAGPAVERRLVALCAHLAVVLASTAAGPAGRGA